MITPWQNRLDHNATRMPTNKQIRAAMEAEIKDLRKAVAKLQRKVESTIRKADVRLNARLKAAQLRALHWRKVAYAVQRDLERVKAGNQGRDGLYCAPGPAITKRGTEQGTKRRA